MTTARVAKLEALYGRLRERRTEGLSFDELAGYAGRFEAFVHDVFGMQLTPQQRSGAAAIEANRQTMVTGGNALGKDCFTAMYALYECYAYGSLSLLSGPTDRQIRSILMQREIGRLWRRARGKLPGERYTMGIRLPDRERSGLLAFTALDPDRWQGHHADRLFIGITEGSAVAGEIIEAAQSCIADEGRLLVVTNPTTPLCACYGFSRSIAWCNLTWSGLDHPNVRTGKRVVAGAITRTRIDEWRKEHGAASRFWTVRVLGRWPESAESSLIRPEWFDAAVSEAQRIRLELTRRTPYGDWRAGCWLPLTIGLDVAREGMDLTSMVVRRSEVVLELHRWREGSTVQNARRVEEHVRRLIAAHGGVGDVVVDEIALGGGIVDELRERLPRLTHMVPLGRFDCHTAAPKVIGYKSSRRAGNPVRFSNRRSECFHALGVLFERNQIAFGADVNPDLLRDLRQELLAHVVEYRADDRVDIGAKDDVRRQVGRSPDLSDALVMCFSTSVDDGVRRVRFG